MILLHPYVRIDRKTVYKEHPNGIEGRLGSRVVLRRIASMLLDHIRRPRVRSPFQTAFCAFPTYLRSTFIDIGYLGSATLGAKRMERHAKTQSIDLALKYIAKCFRSIVQKFWIC